MSNHATRATTKVVTVSRDQVSAARALVRLRGGADKVDPVIAKVAQAHPRPRGTTTPRTAS